MTVTPEKTSVVEQTISDVLFMLGEGDTFVASVVPDTDWVHLTVNGRARLTVSLTPEQLAQLVQCAYSLRLPEVTP